MRKYLFFLKCSSVVVKVAAWIFLFLGIVAALSLFFSPAQNTPRWTGVLVLVFYSFLFGFLFLIAKISDILVKIINAIEKS
ncbi:MAG TPA: hypothetical protein PL125_03485 [Candidatus Omnitrophota bacterium]|nr:hypothetical protein [Candidatus Omnitrophota bacterium]HPT39241.1 hypothetical protein [Candidatus Omnitrophota bacterium]